MENTKAEAEAEAAQELWEAMGAIPREVEEAVPTPEEYQAWFRRKVQEGIEALQAGEVVTAEELAAEDEIWYAQMRRRIIPLSRTPPGYT